MVAVRHPDWEPKYEDEEQSLGSIQHLSIRGLYAEANDLCLLLHVALRDVAAHFGFGDTRERGAAADLYLQSMDEGADPFPSYRR